MTGPRVRNSSSRGTTRGRTQGSGSQSRPLSQPTPMGDHQLVDDADGSHPHPEAAGGGGSEPQNPPSTHHTVAGPSLSHPSTPDSIGTSTPQASQQTLAHPFYSTEVFPHVIRRVKVLYHDGKKFIHLAADDEHTFLSTTDANRFFTREIKKWGNDFWASWSEVSHSVKETWWKSFQDSFY